MISPASSMQTAATRGTPKLLNLHSMSVVPRGFSSMSATSRRGGFMPSLKLVTSMGSGNGNNGGNRIVRTATGGSGGSSDGGGGGLWGLYLQLLDKYPLLTRCLTCGVLNGIGDLFCQLFVEKQEFNGKRCAKFTILGTIYIGPILALWYGFLGRTVTGIITSVALDQLLFAPAFIASIMSVMCTIEGNAGIIPAKLRQDLPEAIKVNWILWVPFQYLNFRFVPQNLRTLAVNIVALLWNVYMSYSAHKHVQEAVVSAPAAPSPTPATASGKHKK